MKYDRSNKKRWNFGIENVFEKNWFKTFSNFTKWTNQMVMYPSRVVGWEMSGKQKKTRAFLHGKFENTKKIQNYASKIK